MSRKKSKNELHFLFVPNILQNICSFLKDVKDIEHLKKCHKRIETIMYHIPISIGVSLKDPLCSKTRSVDRLNAIMQKFPPNWTLLYIVFNFRDHCTKCNFEKLRVKCRLLHYSLISYLFRKVVSYSIFLFKISSTS